MKVPAYAFFPNANRARLQEKLKARGLSDLVRLTRAIDQMH